MRTEKVVGLAEFHQLTWQRKSSHLERRAGRASPVDLDFLVAVATDLRRRGDARTRARILLATAGDALHVDQLVPAFQKTKSVIDAGEFALPFYAHGSVDALNVCSARIFDLCAGEARMVIPPFTVQFLAWAARWSLEAPEVAPGLVQAMQRRGLNEWEQPVQDFAEAVCDRPGAAYKEHERILSDSFATWLTRA